jgi:hypothetical protein
LNVNFHRQLLVKELEFLAFAAAAENSRDSSASLDYTTIPLDKVSALKAWAHRCFIAIGVRYSSILEAYFVFLRSISLNELPLRTHILLSISHIIQDWIEQASE